MRGLADVFHWTSNAEPAPIQVRARLAEAAAPVAPTPAPAARKKPAAKPTVAKAKETK